MKADKTLLQFKYDSVIEALSALKGVPLVVPTLNLPF